MKLLFPNYSYDVMMLLIHWVVCVDTTKRPELISMAYKGRNYRLHFQICFNSICTTEQTQTQRRKHSVLLLWMWWRWWW